MHLAVELDAVKRTAGREQMVRPEIPLFAALLPGARCRVRLVEGARAAAANRIDLPVERGGQSGVEPLAGVPDLLQHPGRLVYRLKVYVILDGIELVAGRQKESRTDEVGPPTCFRTLVAVSVLYSSPPGPKV